MAYLLENELTLSVALRSRPRIEKTLMMMKSTRLLQTEYVRTLPKLTFVWKRIIVPKKD